jgi:hypothetical protein
MSAMKFNDPFESFRKALQPELRPAWLKAGGEQFWRNQDRALDCMEDLAKGWFERRHAGTRAAQEAVVKICSAESPLDAMHGYQQWVSGAFDRLMADSAALQQYFTVAGAATFERVSSPLEASKASPPLAPGAIKTDHAAA